MNPLILIVGSVLALTSTLEIDEVRLHVHAEDGHGTDTLFVAKPGMNFFLNSADALDLWRILLTQALETH